MNIILLIIFIVVSVSLGFLFNKLVIKDFPESARKGTYVKTIVVFFVTALVIFSLISVRNLANYNLKLYSEKLNEYVLENHSDISFVSSGFDMTIIDISILDSIAAEIRQVFPSHTELGIPKLLYNRVIDIAMNEVHRKINAVTATGNVFADENNILTFSSILKILQSSVMRIVNIIILIPAIITLLLFANFIISSLITASKMRKA